jgi:glycine cleavage system H lipoate-binding protein
VNNEILEDNSLLFDDPYDSWLYKIEAADEASLDALFDKESDD